MIRMIAIALLIAILAPRVANAQMGRPPIVDPHTYRSPSGEYTLLVDPTAPSDADAADYVLRHAGRRVWSGRKPFLLLGAAVDDRGNAIGYSQTGSYFHSFIDVDRIDPAGRVTQMDHIARRFSGQVDSPPYPVAAGVVADPIHDRYVLRLELWRNQGSTEEWREYHISNGRRFATWSSAGLLRSMAAYSAIVDAVLLPGTPLVLLDIGNPNGVAFALLNPKGRIVWKWDIANDYGGAGGDDARWKSAILATSRGSFTVGSASRKEAITFAVRPLHRTGWSVRQLGKSPFPVNREKAASLAIEQAVRKHGPLRRLAPIELRNREPVAQPQIRRLSAFTFAGPQHFAFIRDADVGHPALVVATLAGVVASSTPLPALPSRDEARWSSIAWLGGSRYAIGIEYAGKPPPILIVDAAIGKVVPITNFGVDSVKSMAAFPDGRLVVLGQVRKLYSQHDVLGCYGLDGKPRWRWDSDGSYPPDRVGTPELPDGLAIVGDRVAIVEPVGSIVRYYDGNTGAHLRSIELAKVWKRHAGYTSGIWPDKDGGTIILDFLSKDPFVRVGPDGSVRSALTARHANGAEIDATVLGVQIGPDGKLWTSDRDAVYELDDHGVATKLIGELPQTKTLRDVADLTVDPRGTVYALDRRSHVVHVFDRSGHWLRRYEPRPTEFGTVDFGVFLLVSPSGRVCLSSSSLGRATTYIPFDQDGHEMNAVSQGSKGSVPLDPAATWISSFSGLQVVTPNGVARTITRRPDRTWLRSFHAKASVTSSGQVAVLDSSDSTMTKVPVEHRVACLYHADGSPGKMVSLPDGLSDPSIAWDGRHIIIVDGLRSLCLDLTGRILWCASITRSGTPFLVDNGRTLCVWAGGMAIDRYAIP